MYYNPISDNGVDAVSKASAKQNALTADFASLPSGDLPPWLQFFSENKKAHQKHRTQALHRATGTVSNVPPIGGPGAGPQVTQNPPTNGDPPSQKGSGHSGNQGGGSSKKKKKSGGGGSGGQKLEGGIGNPPFLPDVPASTVPTGSGGSPFIIILVVLGVGVGGWYLYHKLHGTAAADKVSTAQANATK